MKHGVRLGLLSVLVTVLVCTTAFGPSLTAMAQATQPADNCFGLSADDCALLKGAYSKDSLAKMTSFSLAYSLASSSSGMAGNSSDLSLKGNGAFEFDSDVASAMATGDVQDASKLTLDVTIGGTGGKNGQDKPFNGEIRILDGTLYFQSDSGTHGQWKSVPLDQAVSAWRQGISKAFKLKGNAAPPNPFKFAAVVGAALKLLQIPGFITAKRVADTTLENQQIANFVFTLDLSTLFASNDFITFIKTVFSDNPAIAKAKPVELKVLANRLSTAIKGAQFTITRTVGLTDKLPHGFAIDWSASIDPSNMPMMTAMMELATPQATPQPIKSEFHFQATITGIGTKANVTAPAGAQPVAPAPTQEATPSAASTAASS